MEPGPLKVEIKEYALAGGDYLMIWVNDRDTSKGGYCLEGVPRHAAQFIAAAIEAACVPAMPDVAALVGRLEAGLEGLPAGPWSHVPWHIAEGDAEVRVAEGWLLCCTSADDYARHIANCDPDTIRTLLSAIKAQAAEISRRDAIAMDLQMLCDKQAAYVPA